MFSAAYKTAGQNSQTGVRNRTPVCGQSETHWEKGAIVERHHPLNGQTQIHDVKQPMTGVYY